MPRLFDFLILDYTPADQCCNPEVFYTCLKCGKCGRVFEEGFLVDDGDTTVTEGNERWL